MAHDLDLLQGTWRIVSLEVDGTAAAAGGATISITGGRFTTAAMGSEYTGRIDLNEASAPKRLTMHFESGPESGKSNHGIYEALEGGEQWRLCLNMTGGAAPAEFATAPGSGRALETLVRGSSPTNAIDESTREPVLNCRASETWCPAFEAAAPCPRA